MPAPKDPLKNKEWRDKISKSGMGRVFSEETRKKISASHKGIIVSEATRKKQSESSKKRFEKIEERVKISNTLKGNIPWNKGKTGVYTEETRKKISESQKGKKKPPRSEEHKKNIGLSHKGKIVSEATRKKLSQAKKGRKNPHTGIPRTIETRRKLCQANKGKILSIETRKKMSDSAGRGENNPHWRGGLSYLPYCEKFNDDLKERVRTFFNHTCQLCGTPQNGKKLAVHHINYNKNTCCDGTKPLFIPLCFKGCHTKTNYNREYWNKYFTDMIETYYGGKCYLTKEEFAALNGVL
jgi:hypothetical protein